jgi:cysteine-rich repeat protein
VPHCTVNVPRRTGFLDANPHQHSADIAVRPLLMCPVMSEQQLKRSFIALALGLGACAGNTSDSSQAIKAGQPAVVQGGPVRGAIFTTTANGSRTDANIYAAKEDVYLDGGPGEHAPARSAALAEGDYYFQVTDPSGKTLLSQDPVECRSFHVSADGVIVAANRGPGGCEHLTGIDQDHAELGAITIQLMPYADTPNPGGEYKAWATPVDDYDASADRFHGFVPRFSKTDNFKVRAVVTPPPPPVCGNGVVEEGELCDDGNTTDGDGCSSTCQTETPPPPCCGNGIVESGEQCDDGTSLDGDGCSATCQNETTPPPNLCGNGVVDAGEQCDEGAANGAQGGDCTADCQCIPQ